MTTPIGPKLGAAIKRRKVKRLREAERSFRPTPTGTSRAAVGQSKAAGRRAIRATRSAVQTIASARGISSDAAAAVLRSVAAGGTVSPVRRRTPTSTRAGQITRRGLMEVGGAAFPDIVRGTAASRARRRVRSASIRQVGERGRQGLGQVKTQAPKVLREVKRFGAGLFGR